MTFQIIKNEALDCELKYILSDGEIWFRGKTVAEVLGYKNTKDAIIKNVDEDEKCKLRDFEWGRSQLPLSNNDKNTIMINESGLYSLILKSKLPKAKKFKKWVTSEVLPSIRKTGSYTIPDIQQHVNPLDERKLTIEERKLKMQEIEFYRELSKDKDPSMATSAKDYILNTLFGGNNLLTEERKWAHDISELCKNTLGSVPNHGQKIYIGQQIKNLYKAEPEKTEKWVNGDMRPVNVYPIAFEPMIIEFLSNNKTQIKGMGGKKKKIVKK